MSGKIGSMRTQKGFRGIGYSRGGHQHGYDEPELDDGPVPSMACDTHRSGWPALAVFGYVRYSSPTEKHPDVNGSVFYLRSAPKLRLGTAGINEGLSSQGICAKLVFLPDQLLFVIRSRLDANRRTLVRPSTLPCPPQLCFPLSVPNDLPRLRSWLVGLANLSRLRDVG